VFKRLTFLLIFVAVIFTQSTVIVFAQDAPEPALLFPTYQTGSIQKVVEQQSVPGDGVTYYIQKVQVLLKSGEVAEIQVGSEFQPLTRQQLVKVGTQVVVSTQPFLTEDGKTSSQYVISDVYRLPLFVWLMVGFFVLTAVVARWRGVFAIVGMMLSFIILTKAIVPPILAGSNPVVISILGAMGIAVVTVYLSHGWGRKSHISLASIIVTMLIAVVLSQLTVVAGHLVGLASEEAYFLQFAGVPHLNLQGLLLAGVILGALGVLDDIVVSQVSVIEQLSLLGEKLHFTDLYFRALEVGKDHVASLVNTLVLAYVGANLPLFLLFYLDQQTPIWVTLNTQVVAEELLRTFVGSISLILAVPLTSLLAAYVYVKWPQKLTSKQKKHLLEHGHVH